MARVEVDRDIRYLDKNGNLLRSRTELSVSKMLSFLGQTYEYNVKIELKDKINRFVTVDFRVGDRYIEVIDSELDIEKFELLRRKMPELDLIALGYSKYASKINELDAIFLFDSEKSQTGSIFVEDPSLSFDYAHILPLVEKCSILHGHTSTIMVEIIGQMKNNLVIDFGQAKTIIKEVLNAVDHKFFINKRYLRTEDALHYYIGFEGPKGTFNLQLPKTTTFLLAGEATVETLSTEIIKLLAVKMPPNVEALGVYVYEGANKGSHIIAEIKKIDRE
jgi:6-pyruvoyltetrahydropterin/6-carboxytetrahydropterin synthase